MSKISLILPTARTPERAERIVHTLRQSHDWNLEIIVTSPGLKINGVINIVDNMTGSSKCLADAINYAHGDYISWLSDICIPSPGCLDTMISFVDEHSEPFIGEFMTRPYHNEQLYRVCTIKGKQYARWGMMTRHTMETIGGFFDPRYACYYGDVDMSLRCWHLGGSVATCKQAIINMEGARDNVTTSNWQKHRQSDHQTFVDAWKDIHPFIATEPTAVWNIDAEFPI